MKQKYSSANTSINKLGRLYKAVKGENLGKVLDFGAGKFLIGTEYLKEHGYDVASYEPSLGDTLPKGKFDTILISNVLNVIKEDEIIIYILNTCKNLLNEGGKIMITVYEGDKTGEGKQSKADCYQRNEKTKQYLKFTGGTIKNNIITIQ